MAWRGASEVFRAFPCGSRLFPARAPFTNTTIRPRGKRKRGKNEGARTDDKVASFARDKVCHCELKASLLKRFGAKLAAGVHSARHVAVQQPGASVLNTLCKLAADGGGAQARARDGAQGIDECSDVSNVLPDDGVHGFHVSFLP